MSDGRAVFLAAFGGAAAAGVFTLLAVLAAEWFRWFIDRPMLKVVASLGIMRGDGFKYVGSGVAPEKLFLEALNPHTKPVTVSSFGLLYKSKKTSTLLPQSPGVFPFQIEGGKSFTQWTSVSQLLENLRERGQRPSDIKGLWFLSSRGKPFKKKIPPDIIQKLAELFVIGATTEV